MKNRTSADWARILESMGVRPAVFAAWAPVFADTVKPGTFSAGDKDLQDFLAQIIHESAGLNRMRESLNYSTQALIAKFGRHRISVEDAHKYGRNGYHAADQESIANCIYGGDFGRVQLGNTQPGDGAKFIGRSPIQITGRANYERIGQLLGQDLDIMPELLEQPHYALEATIEWWEDRVPDSMLGDPERVTRRVNGGLMGLADRLDLTDRAGSALA
jgi:putative chitinase